MNQATRKVEIELFVCPGCEEVIESLAKYVDNLYFHNLNCWNMWKQKLQADKPQDYKEE